MRRNMRHFRHAVVLILFLIACAGATSAQTPNKRLILKDGSYQIVTKYEVKGDRVRYISAERGGEWEELPAALVDWSATDKWAKEHAPGAPGPVVSAPASPGSAEAAGIDKEERDERDDEIARMPTIAAGLRLPDEDGVFVLDTFRGQPELLEVVQNSGDVNTATPHNVLRSTIPLGGTKQLIQLSGPRAKVQLHVSDPVLYVSLDAAGPAEADDRALKVDTHGAGSMKDPRSHSSPASRYVIVRVQPSRDTRTLGALRVSLLGKVTQSEDIVETTSEILPGKHWMKLTPKKPLDIDEYALMEILAPGEYNMAVWDFGINPRAPESKNAITPVEGAR